MHTHVCTGRQRRRRNSPSTTRGDSSLPAGERAHRKLPLQFHVVACRAVVVFAFGLRGGEQSFWACFLPRTCSPERANFRSRTFTVPDGYRKMPATRGSHMLATLVALTLSAGVAKSAAHTQ